MPLHPATSKPVNSSGVKADALLLAVEQFASSYGLQPFKVLVLKDAAVIDAIQPLASEHHSTSSHGYLLIFAVRLSISKAAIDNYITGIASRKKAPAHSLNSYNKFLNSTINNPDGEGKSWAVKQVDLALNHLIANAAALQVPVTMLRGLNLARVDKMLGLKEKQLQSIAAVSLDNTGGYLPVAENHVQKNREMLFEFI